MLSDTPPQEMEEHDELFSKVSPQVKIYNRNFHLRRIIHEEI